LADDSATNAKYRSIRGGIFVFGGSLLVNVRRGTQKSHFARISFAFGAELAVIAALAT
jgi:hypothetical protein